MTIAAADRPGPGRLMRLLVVAVALHRAVSFGLGVADGPESPNSVTATYVLLIAWSAALVALSWRDGAFHPAAVLLDIALAIGVGLTATGWGDSGEQLGHRALQAAAVIAGLGLTVRLQAVVLPALVAAGLAALSMPGPDSASWTENAIYTSILVGLCLTGTLKQRLLRSVVSTLEARGRPGLPAEERRLVHDTAMATLSAIASGAVDSANDRVRARAARDAAYLRQMLLHGRLEPGSLAVGLADVVADAEATGLRVRANYAGLPSDMDPRVTTAMAMASREALNNVRRHAGVDEAWLTAAVEEGEVVVRIVDHGNGLTDASGTGITESIVARMREVGGTGSVESDPGAGTVVELRC
ncbi:sensor histidine kinase [Glycomyces xiaoerkulensis]|uniref:sensor histidine kinase n=1 Tax=Glycomyces xiaoerkulensis TaxID=2038139 RepID=UPI000C259545|nr:hypothetical protein [Glycomyces xiaoerkulensis]